MPHEALAQSVGDDDDADDDDGDDDNDDDADDDVGKTFLEF